MDKFIITGGHPLSGTLRIGGSKNGSLPLMAAALLTKGVTTLTDVPHLMDVRTMSNVLRVIGAKVFGKGKVFKIDTTHCDHFEAPYDLVKTMRASFYVLGPLLARYHRARVSLPGGCAWGPRPVDLHLRGLEALGATINTDAGYVEAISKGRLSGGSFEFDKVSVGATANLIMAAVLAKGKSRLINTAKEPEVTGLILFLRKMGAKIKEIKEGVEITGVPELKPVRMKVIPDRIEAGTFLSAVCLSGGKVRLENCPVSDMASAIDTFQKTGMTIRTDRHSLTAEAPKHIRPLEISTSPYPGFPTDLQAQLMAVLSRADGVSILTDTVYHDRFTHVPELNRLGAQISLQNNTAVIRGVSSLSGAPVMATDLRASAALVAAGLSAKGKTEISRVYHIDRGYERIEIKLGALGAQIERIKDKSM
ncbi:MAG: UDP-N-acetylglucosamine 1-carboxyvinyltransferase [Elusimicrobia bacterium RIFOXYB2_FULL_49_7]|nr:MAG: UDP-N-acetylglucosamine 1-carboxyvinyltransferase [Elusimicrobia bacterium RIFOXYB2_FULL_49_7]